MRAVAGIACLAVSLAVTGVAGASSPTVDPQVAGLQFALRSKGLYTGAIDGIRGPGTVAAVVAFQKSKDLTPDGVAGPTTRAALGPLGGPLFGARLMRRGMTGWDVAVLQFLLAERRAFRGTIDGSFGSQTQAALVRVQRAAGLDPDGEAGPQTVAELCPSGCGAKPKSVRGLLDYWAGFYAVNAHLVRAVAWKESNYQPEVVSPAGARGVMQVKPTTWDWVEAFLIGHTVPETVDGNVRVGVAYLHHLLKRFGDTYTALAAYNQGPTSVVQQGIKPDSGAYAADVIALSRKL